MRRVGLVVFIGLLAACGPNAADVATTTTDLPPTTTTVATTTTVVEATTTSAAVDVCPRGLAWEPGVTYSADCFAVSLSFQPATEGWTSAGASGRWLRLRWHDPEVEGSEVRAAAIAFESSESPEGVLDRIAENELIEEVSERTETKVSGRSGYFVVVKGAPEPGGELLAPDGVPCSPDMPVWWRGGRFGHTILNVNPGEIGVGACHLAALWVLEVGSLSITFIAGTVDPERHDEAVAKIEELFEVMTFQVP